jgi:hypothetical protein
MTTSYNGWPASPRPADFGGISALVLKGESFSPGVRSGDVHFFFSLLVGDIDRYVEPVYAAGWHTADDWGYSYRTNRNANNLSCHASGTAIDYNATRHPNGVAASKTFNAGQIATIRNLCKKNYRGLVRWGGDFTGVPDSMHFEIIGTAGQIRQFLAEFAAAVGGAPVQPPVANIPPPRSGDQPWLMLPAVRSRPLAFQTWYNAYPFKPALLPVISPKSNNFGPQSEAALKKVQARYGLVADGIDGPLTKKLLWDLGFRG